MCCVKITYDCLPLRNRYPVARACHGTSIRMREYTFGLTGRLLINRPPAYKNNFLLQIRFAGKGPAGPVTAPVNALPCIF